MSDIDQIREERIADLEHSLYLSEACADGMQDVAREFERERDQARADCIELDVLAGLLQRELAERDTRIAELESDVNSVQVESSRERDARNATIARLREALEIASRWVGDSAPDDVAIIRAALAEQPSPPPVPIERLECPKCQLWHVDEGEWATKPHKTHRCAGCGHEWRPFDYASVGVAEQPPPPEAERPPLKVTGVKGNSIQVEIDLKQIPKAEPRFRFDMPEAAGDQ
jgi:hypothetical protein